MLLHGDKLLNEGTEPVVGVGDLDSGGIIHSLYFQLINRKTK